MKALILEKNQKLVYKDVNIPAIQPDECLVKIRYSGICSSDIYRGFDNGAYHYPLIMGHEFSGVVEKAGARVNGFKPGDGVAVFPLIPCRQCRYCQKEQYAQCLEYDYYGSRRDGAFSEYLAVKEWNLFAWPDAASLDRAALMEPAAVAVHAARKVAISSRQADVAVYGAGFIGLVTALYLKKIVDAEKIHIIDRNPAKLEIARRFGFTCVPAEEWESLKKLRLEYVFEVCGAVETFRQSVQLAASHGHVIWVGNIDGDLEFPRKEISSILRKELTIHGCWNATFQHKDSDDWHHARRFLLDNADIDTLISHKTSLARGAEIFKELFGRKIQRKNIDEVFLKVMFEV